MMGSGGGREDRSICATVLFGGEVEIALNCAGEKRSGPGIGSLRAVLPTGQRKEGRGGKKVRLGYWSGRSCGFGYSDSIPFLSRCRTQQRRKKKKEEGSPRNGAGLRGGKRAADLPIVWHTRSLRRPGGREIRGKPATVIKLRKGNTVEPTEFLLSCCGPYAKEKKGGNRDLYAGSDL